MADEHVRSNIDENINKPKLTNKSVGFGICINFQMETHTRTKREYWFFPNFIFFFDQFNNGKNSIRLMKIKITRFDGFHHGFGMVVIFNCTNINET